MIELRNVSHSFGDRPVLCDVSFSVGAGEFVSVVGPSGSGKTTLLRIIAGLLNPTTGKVFADGEQSRGVFPRSRLGVVFQRPVLLPWRTARDNVRLPLELHANHATNARDPSEVLRSIGLAGFEEAKPFELSGGMQHRVALARALVFNPKILLMDEPFSALDEILRERLDIEVLDLTERHHQTVVFVTHSVEEAVLLSDRVVILSDRPAVVRDVIDVTLGRPRERERRSPAHLELIERIRWSLRK